MKIKYLLVFLFFITFLTSCSRDENPEIMPENEPLVTKISAPIFFINVLYYFGWADYDLHFEYDHLKRLTKQIGGFEEINTSYGTAFSKDVYSSLIYEGNKVTVEDFSSMPLVFTVPKKTKYFILNEQNKIQQKEIPHTISSMNKKQVFSYKNGLIDEVKTTLPNRPYDQTDPNGYVLTYSERFFYDSNGNLIRTEYYEQHNGVNMGRKVVRKFENYDNSSNPFKRFTLLDNYFYRSLSKNNFRTFKEEEYYNGEFVLTLSHQEWVFNYDTKGQIIIN